MVSVQHRWMAQHSTALEQQQHLNSSRGQSVPTIDSTQPLSTGHCPPHSQPSITRNTLTHSTVTALSFHHCCCSLTKPNTLACSGPVSTTALHPLLLLVAQHTQRNAPCRSTHSSAGPSVGQIAGLFWASASCARSSAASRVIRYARAASAACSLFSRACASLLSPSRLTAAV
jgi:hypothetical protein